MRPLKEKISITIDNDLLEKIREKAVGAMRGRPWISSEGEDRRGVGRGSGWGRKHLMEEQVGRTGLGSRGASEAPGL